MTVATEKIVYRHGRDRDFTEEEYDALMDEMMEAHQKGDMDKFFLLGGQVPIKAEIALIFRDVYGCRFIRESGLDVTEAEIKWGKDWLKNGPEEGVLPYDETER